MKYKFKQIKREFGEAIKNLIVVTIICYFGAIGVIIAILTIINIIKVF